ncbi:MAG: hypothetical protein ACREQA_06995 [Candidatus Binatia bacterium]
MAKKETIPEKYRIWMDARQRYRLSHAHIQMARELGMNPGKFGKIGNRRQEPWKAPLPIFIEELYFKHFGKRRPNEAKSVEQIVKEHQMKQEERRRRKQMQKEWEQTESTATTSSQ